MMEVDRKARLHIKIGCARYRLIAARACAFSDAIEFEALARLSNG